MKYISAEKLKAEIERRMDENCKLGEKAECFSHRAVEDNDVLALIDKLRQEQSEDSKGKFVFPKFLYARTTDNKTIDVSYAPQSMDAIEYVRNNSAEGQPEVDLEEEVAKVWEEFPPKVLDFAAFTELVTHFYELGLKARKEE